MCRFHRDLCRLRRMVIYMGYLIIYYSRKGENYVGGSIVTLPKGNSLFVAEYLHLAVGGDLFELETSKPYAASYDQCIAQAKAELLENARPALKNYLHSLDGYDNIFLCGPCWWGTYPCAMFTQLERLDFAGKRVFAVMTHEGSGLGHCERDLQLLCPGAVFGKGLAVLGSRAVDSKEQVTAWAKQCINNNN